MADKSAANANAAGAAGGKKSTEEEVGKIADDINEGGEKVSLFEKITTGTKDTIIGAADFVKKTVVSKLTTAMSSLMAASQAASQASLPR